MFPGIREYVLQWLSHYPQGSTVSSSVETEGDLAVIPDKKIAFAYSTSCQELDSINSAKVSFCYCDNLFVGGVSQFCQDFFRDPYTQGKARAPVSMEFQGFFDHFGCNIFSFY